MPLAAVTVIVLLMKLLDIPPVGAWPWLWVLAPFGALILWWQVISPWMGWDKKAAAAKAIADEKAAAIEKKKNRGF